MGTSQKNAISTKRIADNTIILTAASMLMKLLAYVAYFLLARLFSVEEVGAYALLITSYLMAELLSNLGLDKIVIRELAKQNAESPDGRIVYSTIAFRLLSAIIAYLGCLLLVGWMYPDIMARYGMGAVVFFTTIPIVAFARSIECIFMARERMFFVALSQFCERLYVVLLLVAIWFLGLNFNFFLLLFPGAGLFRALVQGVAFQWPRVPENFGRYFFSAPLRSLYLQGSQMLAVEILALVYFRIDIFMLGKMAGLPETGRYQIAYKIFDCCIALFAGYLLALFPKISRERENADVLKSAMIGLIVILPVSLTIIALRMPILQSFGPEYGQASTVLIFLMLSLPLVFITSLLANYAVASHRLHFLVKLATLLASTNILLNWLLIPRYAMAGAALSTLACEIMSLLILLAAQKGWRKSRSGTFGISA